MGLADIRAIQGWMGRLQLVVIVGSRANQGQVVIAGSRRQWQEQVDFQATAVWAPVGSAGSPGQARQGIRGLVGLRGTRGLRGSVVTQATRQVTVGFQASQATTLALRATRASQDAVVIPVSAAQVFPVTREQMARRARLEQAGSAGLPD